MKSIRLLGLVSYLVAALTLCIIPVLAFAGNGVAGDEVVDMLTKLLKDNTLAVAIYTTIVGLVGIGLRVLLKKIPTVMQGVVGIFFWKVAAALFGDGVILENHKDAQFIKDQLIKKYPLLQIKIK